jgi:two-component sensor histidine kinase
MSSELKKYIELVVEARLREADVTDGKAEWGSDKHVKDLQNRIEDLTKWRDRQRKGTESRANYARLVSRLRAELKSAMRQASKNKPQTELDDE